MMLKREGHGCAMINNHVIMQMKQHVRFRKSFDMLHMLPHKVRDAPISLTAVFNFGSLVMRAMVEKYEKSAIAAYISQLQQR
jgi:hypothetical protein